MKTAVITGASSGLGRELAIRAAQEFPDISRFILIARRRERLESLARELAGHQVFILDRDLCDPDFPAFFKHFLETHNPDIRLLVNCAGCGYLGNVGRGDVGQQLRMVDLNIRALTAVTHLCLPYMDEGARILNLSSIASFCPNARMTVYSASKAYVSAFSRGLGEELRRRRISVTAVCPGPMPTEFLEIGHIAGNSPMFASLPYCDVYSVAAEAIAAAKARRSVCTPMAFYKAYRILAKLLPHKWLVRLTKT